MRAWASVHFNYSSEWLNRMRDAQKNDSNLKKISGEDNRALHSYFSYKQDFRVLEIVYMYQMTQHFEMSFLRKLIWVSWMYIQEARRFIMIWDHISGGRVCRETFLPMFLNALLAKEWRWNVKDRQEHYRLFRFQSESWQILRWTSWHVYLWPDRIMILHGL